jgi:hypothetical protein
MQFDLADSCSRQGTPCALGGDLVPPVGAKRHMHLREHGHVVLRHGTAHSLTQLSINCRACIDIQIVRLSL